MISTLWNKSLRPTSKDVAFVALHLDSSLLGEGGPVMHLWGIHGNNGHKMQMKKSRGQKSSACLPNLN